VDEAVDYLLQACEAIAEAHVLGIVHRDLKPANLFLTRRSGGLGWVKVLDFGISKMSSLGAAGHMTNTSAVLGSPFYMSPEQLRSSRDVDARADIWSLGVIAYELLARHVPFRGESIAELCVSILNNAPPSLAAVRPDVPAGLEAGIFKCLEKNRDQRFPNVAELALALRPFARERGRVSVDNIARTLSSAGVSLSDSSTESVRNPAAAPAHARDAMPSYHTGSSSSGSGTKGESSGAAVATTDKQATHAAWGNTGTTRRGNGVVAAVAGGFVLLVAGLGFAAWRLASAVVQPEDTATLRSADVQAIGAPSSKPAAAPPRATAAPAIDIAPVPSAAPAAEELASANAAEPVELAAPRQVVRAVKTPTRVATGPKTPPKQEPEVTKAPPKTEGTATTRPAAGLLDGRH
jgi:serine/threonine-protein kinase